MEYNNDLLGFKVSSVVKVFKVVNHVILSDSEESVIKTDISLCSI